MLIVSREAALAIAAPSVLQGVLAVRQALVSSPVEATRPPSGAAGLESRPDRLGV
jgi:hypothetical protein